MENPLVRPSRERTRRGLLEASAAPVGPTKVRALAPRAPVSNLRREISVMRLSVHDSISRFIEPR